MLQTQNSKKFFTLKSAKLNRNTLFIIISSIFFISIVLISVFTVKNYSEHYNKSKYIGSNYAYIFKTIFLPLLLLFIYFLFTIIFKLHLSDNKDLKMIAGCKTYNINTKNGQQILFNTIIEKLRIYIAIFDGKELELKYISKNFRELIKQINGNIDINNDIVINFLGNNDNKILSGLRSVYLEDLPSFSFEKSINLDGENFYLSCELLPLKSENSNNRDLLLFGFDNTNLINARNTAEQTAKLFREKSLYFKTLIESINDPIWIFDKNLNISDINHEAIKIAGASCEEEIKCMSIHDYYNILKTESLNKISESNGEQLYISKAIKEKKTIRNTMILENHDNTLNYFNISSSPIIDQKSNVIGAIAVWHDISVVECQKDFIKNIFETIDIPLFTVKYPEMHISYTNKKINWLVDQLYDDLTSNKISIFLNHPDIYKCIRESATKCINAVNEKAEFKCIDGTTYYYKIICSPNKYNKSDKDNIICSMLDITPEINFSKKQKTISDERESFFTSASHELRSPLTVIYSILQLLLSNRYKNSVEPSIVKMLLVLKQNTLQLLKLVNNILDLSKAQAGFMKLNLMNTNITEITELITDSIRPYAESKKIRINYLSCIKDKEISLDRDKYERILLNLLSNAIKFTPENGHIDVSIDSQDKYVILSVQDSGVGIPEDKISQIFNRFIQVDNSMSQKTKGTGIGLSLVKAIVEQMNGKIDVKSNINKGTAFKIYIPDTFERGKESPNIDDQFTEIVNIEFSDVNPK